MENGLRNPSETTGKVITCKGKRFSYNTCSLFLFAQSLLIYSSAHFHFVWWVWSCYYMGSGWAICDRRSESGSPSENGGSDQDPLYFNMSYRSQRLARGGMYYIHVKPTFKNFIYNIIWIHQFRLILSDFWHKPYYLLKNEAQRAYPRILGHEASG